MRMMYSLKTWKLTFLFLLFTVALQAQISNTRVPIYYQTVDLSQMPWPEYYKRMDTKLIAEDMAQLLQQACRGFQFDVQAWSGQSGNGIFLLLDRKPATNEEERCLVTGNGSSQLRFSAAYLTGLSYGVYSYLDRLGFRFYLPGNNWTHIPTLSSPFSASLRNIGFQPSFKHRMFTPSGAMPRVKGLDEAGLLEKQWHDWYRRNRMGSAHLILGGHVGESFNLENRAALEADLTILAPFQGKRQFHIGAKLDPTNPRGIALFEDWILKKKEQHDRSVAPVFPRHRYESVDPADGYDYCQTPECLKQFPTISDQVFHIANRCADRVKAVDPMRGVSLYAYADKADTPHLKLRQNVHVSLVATGFQSIDIPAGIIQRWKRKTSLLSVYDYLNIGVWSYDQPFYNIYSYMPFLDYLRRERIEGLSYETSSSAMGSGVLQYFILRYLNQPYTNVNREIDQFCQNNFGPAAAPVRRLFDLWYGNDKYIQTLFDRPVSTADDLGRMFRWLDEALATPGITTAHRTRMEELQIFTGYLALQHEFWGNMRIRGRIVKDDTFKQERLEQMLNYVWENYSTGIFHSTELTNHLRNLMPEATAYRARWDYYQSPQHYARFQQRGSSWRTIYHQLRAQYLPLGVTTPSVSDTQLRQLARQAADSVVFETVDEKAFGSMRYSMPVFCADPTQVIEIRYTAQASERVDPTSSQIGFLAMNSADFRYMNRRFIRASQRQGMIRFKLPRAGHYTLTLSHQQGTPTRWVIRSPKNLLYVNKAILPVQGIVLSGRESQKNTTNEWVAVLAPTSSDSLRYQLLYPDAFNTTEVRNGRGDKLPVIVDANSGMVTIAPSPGGTTPLLFLRNSLHRWGTTLVNTAPYYFFLKPPPAKR